MLLETILTAALSPAYITLHHCNTRKESAEFMAKMSYFMDESDMRRIFPRKKHIIYEIYNTEQPEIVVPNWVFNKCMRDAAV